MPAPVAALNSAAVCPSACLIPLAQQWCTTQGDHLSGKPGKPENVREFETCQGNVRDFVNSQGIVRGMSGKKSCQGKVFKKCSLLVNICVYMGI